MTATTTMKTTIIGSRKYSYIFVPIFAEKLHRQVTIMKKSESFSRSSKSKVNEDSFEEVDEAESNQRLIEQLRARIVELELKGDKLMAEKEELEASKVIFGKVNLTTFFCSNKCYFYVFCTILVEVNGTRCL